MAGVDYSQFKGKPFQVVSKLGVRYTGIFDHISQEDQTICLAQVFNHGTEDRPTPRKLPGSATTLGWVRFHTESIESLALVENYIPPGEEAPVDPILASVSNTAPPAAGQAGPAQPPSRRESHDLPPKPSQTAISAATALDRVQESLHDLSVSEPQSDGQRPRRNFRPPPKAPEVPDAEFDFSKGTQAFEKEREGRRITSPRSEAEEIGEPENAPHPSALAAMSPQAMNGNGLRNGQAEGAGAKASTAYKKGSFFDGLSGESSRISRNEERHRNFDTFGEAGGNDQSGHAPGAGRGGYGGRGRGGGGGGYGGRGGYGQQGQQGGYGRREGYGRQEQGYGGGGEGYGRGRGRGYGYRGGHAGAGGDQ